MHILSPPGETHEVFAVFAEPRPDACAFGPEQFEPGVRFGVPLHAVTLGAVSSDFHQRRDHNPFDVLCQRKRSEEHTSELQSLMRISYAVFCLKKKNKKNENPSLNHLKML